MIAFKRSDGGVTWTTNTEGACDPPLVQQDFVVCPGARVFSYDPQTGRLLWQLDRPSLLEGFSLTQGASDARTAYVGTSNGEEGDAGTEVIAIDGRSGDVRWRRGFTGEGWLGTRFRSLTLSPEGDLLVALETQYPPRFSTESATVIIAVDPATGNERWRYQDGDRTTDRGIGGLTLWEDLVLYSDATGGEAVAFNRTTRQVVWRAPWEPSFLGTLRPPIVADGVAYFTAGDGRAYAVDARTGARRWATGISEGGGYRSHEVCGPVVLANNGPVEILDRATGRRRGKLLRDGDSAGQMAVADGFVYVSARSGIYAFDCSTLGG